MSTAFAPFLTSSAFPHRLDGLEHPCSRSEYSSRNTSSLYRAGAPDAHPTGTAQNPSTGCRDIDHTATIHPPCAAKWRARDPRRQSGHRQEIRACKAQVTIHAQAAAILIQGLRFTHPVHPICDMLIPPHVSAPVLTAAQIAVPVQRI